MARIDIANSTKIIIPFQARQHQELLFEAHWGYRFLTAVCHRRFGKTVAAAIWLIKMALKGRADFRGYYIAPNQKQAKRVVWGYFRTFLKNFGKMVRFNETELRIDFPNGAQIYLVGSENVEALRGIYIDAAVMDEMASWTNASYAFYEVLYPAMQDRKGLALIIGTVKGLDMFFDFYNLGLDDQFPEWNSVIYKASETGVFTPLEQKQMRLLMERKEPGAYDREMECDFFAKTSEVLITPEEYYQAMGRVLDPRATREHAMVYGYDPGYTIDPASLCKRKGPQLFKPHEIKNKDSAFQAEFIFNEYKKDRPKYIYVDAGQGEGVITRLRNDYALEHVVIPVWFNGKSPSASCTNKRSYMYREFKLWLATGSVPEDDRLLKEMTNQLLDRGDADNKIKLAPKNKIKDLIGRSPNSSDAAALTMSAGREVLLDGFEDMAAAGTEQEAMAVLYRQMVQQQQVEYDPQNFLNKEM